MVGSQFRSLPSPPSSLPKPATESSLAERPFCGHFSRVGVYRTPVLMVEHRGSSNCHHSPDLGRRFRARLAEMRSLDGPISSLFVGVERKRQASCLGGDESNREGHLDHSANRLRSKSSRVPGLEAFAFEGTRARSRNKDGKNVPNATTAFKTVACLNVTLGHVKIGCAVLVVGWHALGRVQEGERGLRPDLYDTIRWFCQVTGLASGLRVASLVADIVERLPEPGNPL
jgi:hypothetical protein